MKNPLVPKLLAVARYTKFYKDLDSGEKDMLYARQIVQLHWKRGNSWAVGPGSITGNTLLVPSKDLIGFKDPEAASKKYKAGEYWGTKKNPTKDWHLDRYRHLSDDAKWERGQGGISQITIGRQLEALGALDTYKKNPTKDWHISRVRNLMQGLRKQSSNSQPAREIALRLHHALSEAEYQAEQGGANASEITDAKIMANPLWQTHALALYATKHDAEIAKDNFKRIYPQFHYRIKKVSIGEYRLQWKGAMNPVANKMYFTANPRITLSAINKVVRKLGYTERLVRGNGYYYWHGGNASSFSESGVYGSPYLDQMSIDEWVKDLQARIKHARLENPVATKSMIICPRCGATYTQTPTNRISSCVKCGYRPNPTHNELLDAGYRLYQTYGDLDSAEHNARYLQLKGYVTKIVGTSLYYRISKNKKFKNPILAPILGNLGSSVIAGIGLGAGFHVADKLRGKK